MSDRDKFDKFTQRTRKVLSLAQEEAMRFQHNYIGTEHLLLGLVKEGEGVAAKVLTNLGVNLNKVQSQVEFIIGRGDRIVLGEIGLTPRAKKVIELAIDEARRLNHHYIGTEHILLGLVREGEGIASGVLESLGVNLEKVRTQTMRVLSQSHHQVISKSTQQPAEVEKDSTPEAAPEQIASLSMQDFHLDEDDTVQPLSQEDKDFIQSGIPLGQTERARFDQFTVRARRSLRFALEEAMRFQHNYIGTEHLLLGLVRENGGVAAMVLSTLGVELSKVRRAVEFIIGRGEHNVTGQIGLTPRSKKVIELAADEARRLKHDYIGTEHLLLGLVREGEGIAAGVLESLGATMQRVRAQTLLVLDHISKDNPPDQGGEEIPPA